MPPAIDQLKQAKIVIDDEIYIVDNEGDTIDGNVTLKQGDVVIDLQDGCYGQIDFVENNHAAVRDGEVVEIGVPLSRLLKLRKELK